MPNTIRPVEVDVSTPSRSDLNTIPRSPRVFTVCTIPDRLRPKRSSATTVTVSPARAYPSTACEAGAGVGSFATGRRGRDAIPSLSHKSPPNTVTSAAPR